MFYNDFKIEDSQVQYEEKISETGFNGKFGKFEVIL